MSWSKRVKHPSEVLKKGDVVEAMVLSIDAENQRLSLGLKQLATDIWDDFFSRHNVGDIIEGKVTRMTNFGAFVELDEGIEGLIHVSEFDDSHGGEKIDLQVGNSYQMKIIKLSPQERKIGLSIRALKTDEFRADWETYPGQRRAPARRRSAITSRTGRTGNGLRARASTLTPAARSPAAARSDSVNTPGGSMTKAELVEEVSRVSDLTKKHSEVIVDTVFKSIIDALHRGEKIELRGFGSFRLRKREPRKGRNPKTGDKVDVPPKKVPYFKPGKELKELINREAEATSVVAAASIRSDPRRRFDRRSRRWTISGPPGDFDYVTSEKADRVRVLPASRRPGKRCRARSAGRLRRHARLRHPQPVSLQQRPPDGGAEPARACARRSDGRRAQRGRTV